MTASDVTASDIRTEEAWKPIPGFSGYEASDNSVWRRDGDGVVQVSGGIRSVDRMIGGRQLKGVLLKGRLNNSHRGGGYVIVNMTDDTGTKRTMLAHLMILLAHRGAPGEGQETLHDPKRGRLWCRVPEDMRYGTRLENLEDWKLNNGAKPKPPKSCARCGGPFTGNGRRCHPCVVSIGQEAARLLQGGVTLGAAAEQLEYPSVDGLHTLAVKYGGYGIERSHWSQRVIATVRHLLPGGNAK